MEKFFLSNQNTKVLIKMTWQYFSILSVKLKLSHPSAGAAAAGWHGPPPRGRGRWRAAQVGTCSCRWGESASWTRTSFWARAGPGLSTAPRRPAGGDRDRVSALSYRGNEGKSQKRWQSAGWLSAGSVPGLSATTSWLAKTGNMYLKKIGYI